MDIYEEVWSPGLELEKLRGYINNFFVKYERFYLQFEPHLGHTNLGLIYQSETVICVFCQHGDSLEAHLFYELEPHSCTIRINRMGTKGGHKVLFRDCF
ncbi:hypothetical protein ES703_120174 [subsurface metagenome]